MSFYFRGAPPVLGLLLLLVQILDPLIETQIGSAGHRNPFNSPSYSHIDYLVSLHLILTLLLGPVCLLCITPKRPWYYTPFDISSVAGVFKLYDCTQPLTY